MSNPPPRKKKSTTQRLKSQTGPLPTGKKKAAKGKMRSKKKSTMLPQLVGGLTLLGLIGGAGVFAVYVANRAIPEVKPVDAGATPAIARPSVEPKLPSREVKRPGLAVAMAGEIYFPKALDMKDSPIEGPVQGLLGREVITVFADGKFRPEAPISRAQFVTWCYNAVMAQSMPGPDPFVSPHKAFKTVNPDGDVFGDVPADHWAAGVLATVKASGVLGETTPFFRPDAPLSREEWLVLSSALATPLEQKAALATAASDETAVQVAYRKLNFTDYESLKPAFKPHVAFVFGHDDRMRWVIDTFGLPKTPSAWEPQKTVTRGEAATFIGAAYEKIGHMAF